MLASLRLNDKPLSYRPAFGPGVPIRFTYDSAQSSDPDGLTHANVGGGWRMNWIESIEEVIDQAGVTRMAKIRGGLSGTFVIPIPSGPGSGAAKERPGRSPVQISSITVPGSAGQPTPPRPNAFRRTYPNGLTLTYAHSIHRGTVSLPDGGTAVKWRRFLTEVRDKAGNAVTLHWQQAKLLGITDATGKSIVFGYDATFADRIATITDPFGRQAVLGYDAQGRLTSITDPVGIKSEFHYAPGAAGRIDSLTTPYGTTTFDYLSNDFGPGVEVLEPNGAKQRITYQHWTELLPDSEPAEQTPEGVANGHLNYFNTLYWDRRAMRLDSAAPVANARIIHWLRAADGARVVGVPHSYKEPGAARVWLGYDGQAASGSRLAAGNGLQSIAQMVTTASGPLAEQHWMTRNGFGLLTHAFDPLGRETHYTYEADQVSLHKIEQKRGETYDVLAQYEDYAHGVPTKITDAAGQVTHLQVNARGQVTQVENAKHELTAIAYGETVGSPAYGRLTALTRAAGTGLAATTTTGYDAYGRVASVTQPGPYTVTLGYDAIGGNPLRTLDRIERVSYPDGTSEFAWHDKLDVAGTQDRLGRWTWIERDAGRHVTKVTDPAGRTTEYNPGGCCGTIDGLKDGNGNLTEWSFDAAGRKTGKTIAGAPVAAYGYDPLSGNLASETDALGNVKHYKYAVDGNLAGVHYEVINAAGTAETANVSFTYDSDYDRLTGRTDAQGPVSVSYGYHPAGAAGAGRLSAETTDLGANGWTFAYSYDELGRVVMRQFDGTTETRAYDALGRVTMVNNPLCIPVAGTGTATAFSHSYQGNTGRLSALGYPVAGLALTVAYGPAAADYRLAELNYARPQADASVPRTTFGYSWDAAGRLTHWSRLEHNPAVPWEWPGVRMFEYDESDQVARSVSYEWDVEQHREVWSYDGAGNRTGVQRDAAVTQWTVNAFNQLGTQSAGGLVEIAGTVDRPASVSVAGHAAQWSWEGGWRVKVPVGAGENVLPITASEAEVSAGFVAQTGGGSLVVNVPALAPRTLSYDANGNLLGDGLRTYQWDAENRLVKISYVGTARSTEFSYDGLSRRIGLVEKNGATVLQARQFIWEGLRIAAERDAAGQLVRRYWSEGEEQIDAAGTATALYYVRDHLGSVREMVDRAGAVRARYDYGVWGERTKREGDLDTAVGYTGHYYHAPSGLHLAPYRAYDAETGRWLSRDPIEEGGGLNLYGYVGNTPLIYIDPLGFSARESWIRGCEIAGAGAGAVLGFIGGGGGGAIAGAGVASIATAPTGAYLGAGLGAAGGAVVGNAVGKATAGLAGAIENMMSGGDWRDWLHREEEGECKSFEKMSQGDNTAPNAEFKEAMRKLGINSRKDPRWERAHREISKGGIKGAQQIEDFLRGLGY